MHHKKYKKVVLVVLDGFGVASASHSNAIALANPITLDYIVREFPNLTLQASGPLVGLPWGEMGNSEVGHLNMGAGRIVGQDLPRINNAISSRQFFKNPVLLEAMQHVKQNHSHLHLMGLVSNGGVHSLDEHLYAILALAAEQKLDNVYIHMFTDGRDTAEKVAIDSLRKLKEKIKTIGVGAIATITGRFYAMDRGGHWQQTESTYHAFVEGRGQHAASPEECIAQNYNQNIFDEMIPPTVIMNGNEPVATIKDNDAIVFFNFRPDRAMQLTQAFVNPSAMDIKTKHAPLNNLYFATMTQYFVGLPVHVVFPLTNLNNNLAEIISRAGLRQLRIAESEKYAHVTSFFNCGVSTEFPGEERVIVKSPDNTRNYMDKPKMSAAELTSLLIEKLVSTDTNFFLINYANPDMVGHTGNLQAAIKAVTFVDEQLRKLMEKTLLADAALIITADHGNIEEMINMKSGQINKDHSTNPIPFLLVANEFRCKIAKQTNYVSLSAKTPEGVISDIAPTVLDLFGLPKPAEMTAINLLDNIEVC